MMLAFHLRGKLIVITGPNGGGKSTIAKLIMGIEKATSGQIILDGEDITNLSITERAKRNRICISTTTKNKRYDS